MFSFRCCFSQLQPTDYKLQLIQTLVPVVSEPTQGTNTDRRQYQNPRSAGCLQKPTDSAYFSSPSAIAWSVFVSLALAEEVLFQMWFPLQCPEGCEGVENSLR